MAQLLRGGRVLVHDDKENVSAIRADILIRDGKIEKVEPNITVDESVKVLDCTDKLISPGMIDTHHHVWQTQLRGLHADQSLLEYLPPGNTVGGFYEPDDIFYGQLAGLMEALNGGITTLLDFSHCNYSPEHVYAAIQANEASGIRSVYGYTPTGRIKYKEDGAPEQLPLFEPWIMETFSKLAEASPWQRTSLGFAFDGMFLPVDMLKPVFEQFHAAPNVKVFTTHDNSWSMFHNKPSCYKTITENGLLDPKEEAHYVLAHGNRLVHHPAAEVKKNRFFASITPVSELSMGMGEPVPIALDRDLDDFASNVSVGIDCHTIGEGFIPGQLRAQLLAVRANVHAKAQEKGQWYASMNRNKGKFPGVQDAFNLATLSGARALAMEGVTGSIKAGYKADLVIWETRTPNMLAAALENPLAAIVLHSQPGDVAGVLVDGIVRKWNGKLLPTAVPAPSGLLAAYSPPVEGELPWDKIADAVLQSREKMVPAIKKSIDLPAATMGMIDAFYLKKEGLLDPVTEGYSRE